MSHFIKYDEQHIMNNRFYTFIGFMSGFFIGSLITMIIISTEHQLF